MPEPGSTPLQSLLGGVGLAFPAQTLLSLNGKTLGISGFIHGAARGNLEDVLSALGMIAGGFAVGAIEGIKPTIQDTPAFPLILSGLLVGAGSKMGNGCTSGHMICGLPQSSVRSIAATATFFVTGSLTTRLGHGTLVTPPGDSSLGPHGAAFLASGSAAVISAIVTSRAIGAKFPARLVVAFCSAFAFSMGLRLANLTDARRVLGFLLNPTHSAFDPSLLYLAIGAVPLASVLYYAGSVRVQRKGKVDAQLLTGAAMFGIGWGIEGICPGPALVNFGWALATGANIRPLATWLAAVIIGGFCVPS